MRGEGCNFQTPNFFSPRPTSEPQAHISGPDAVLLGRSGQSAVRPRPEKKKKEKSAKLRW